MAARQEFPIENVRTLVEKGNDLVKAAWSMDEALFHFQQSEFRKITSQWGLSMRGRK